MDPARRRCAGTRGDGRPCAALAMAESSRCFTHDPGRAADRDAARRKGGANSSKRARLRGLMPPRLIPVFDQLEAALSEVHLGDLDTRRATAMAALARALVAVLTAGELEDRVRTLERQASEDRGRRAGTPDWG